MNRFEIKEDFYLNGEKIKIISGGIHYFRVVPEYWRDRLEKIKALGCNTIETYVAWNVHEPKKGEFCFEGMADLGRFIELAKELGLWVIVRPSPYICAEWELGGLPAWLLAEDGMRLRSSYEPYLNHVRDYYKKLFEILTPLQVTNGGPILMFQIENEYGAYGEDTAYLESLKQMMTENGVNVPFITSDGPWGDYLACGKVDGVLQSANFGSKAKEQFAVLKKHIGDKPMMCMEFWVGWFDAWGDKHHTEDPEKHTQDLNDILELGSVNIYMAEGGTNFGFMNGANYYDRLTPDVTSYDYDALLTEDGRITEKYLAFQKVIGRFRELPKTELSTNIGRTSYGELPVREKVGLFEVLDDISAPVRHPYPQPMEKLGQSYGYILYRSELVRDKEIEKVRLFEANDRAKVYVDGKEIATLYDRELLEEKPVEKVTGDRIDILMENMGRVNYGVMMERQNKGIKGAVVLNGHQHYQWTHYPLPLNHVENIPFDKGYTEGLPAFYRFEFEAQEQTDGYRDTFLDVTGFGKGCAFINGFNLGRFWETGPQGRLYLPGPLIRAGKNEIILFETEGKAAGYISLCDEPKLDL
ncbi:MAG: beta-galactosidase family protein [Lachnospiraceae bacterium]